MPTVAVKGCPTPEARPARTHLLKGFGPSPFLDGLFADRKQRGAAALVLRAHDLYAPLVDVAGASPTRYGLDDLDLFTVLFDQMADVHNAFVTGVGAQALETRVVRLYSVVVILGGWVRWVRGRLVLGHWSLTLLWSRPLRCLLGRLTVRAVSYLTPL
jgi:hypothetical protein